MQNITPCLWFDDQAEKVAKFYCSVFKRSKVLDVLRYGETGRGKPGAVMLVRFQLFGREFSALNGGPQFPHSEAVSFVVPCDSQREVDLYWRKLQAGGGRASMCGWLKDKFGVSWQIVPTEALELLRGREKARAARVMSALMEMQKIDLRALRQAADGR